MSANFLTHFEIPLARKIIASRLSYVLQLLMCRFDIRALEKSGKRLDTNSVVFRVLSFLVASAKRAAEDEAFCRGKNRP